VFIPLSSISGLAVIAFFISEFVPSSFSVEVDEIILKRHRQPKLNFFVLHFQRHRGGLLARLPVTGWSAMPFNIKCLHTFAALQLPQQGHKYGTRSQTADVWLRRKLNLPHPRF
jgi:hypothetical protein